MLCFASMLLYYVCVWLINGTEDDWSQFSFVLEEKALEQFKYNHNCPHAMHMVCEYRLYSRYAHIGSSTHWRQRFTHRRVHWAAVTAHNIDSEPCTRRTRSLIARLSLSFPLSTATKPIAAVSLASFPIVSLYVYLPFSSIRHTVCGCRCCCIERKKAFNLTWTNALALELSSSTKFIRLEISISTIFLYWSRQNAAIKHLFNGIYHIILKYRSNFFTEHPNVFKFFIMQSHLLHLCTKFNGRLFDLWSYNDRIASSKETLY